jgi:glycosyltransferase involved in cell wall biosynthesis
MSQRLIAAGHQVTMICGRYATGDQREQSTARVSWYDDAGIKVASVNEPYGNEMSFWQRIRAFGRFAKQAEQIVKSLDADLVFATSTPLTVGIPGMKGARKLGVPFIFEVRDLWPELPIAMGIVRNPVMKWYLKRMERRIYEAADHIIALAPGIKEGIIRSGYPEARITMIPNCSDLDLFQPCMEKGGDSRFGSPDEFRLVFTGAHGLANGLDAVLDAVAELQKRGESGIRFVFVGSGGQRDRLIKRSRDEGLDAMITWSDPVPKAELATLLPRMDVGMMILKNVPAFYYGTSPNKFFDYIASGLPVLNNYQGWLAEMITDRGLGVAVPPDDPSAFADAVLWLRDNPDERLRMGQNARHLAEEQFSRDKLAKQFVSILEQVHSVGRH